MPFRDFASRYFDSRWIPSVVAFSTLAAFTLVALADWRPLAIAANGLLGVSILGVLAASIWNLVKRRWAKGVINFVMFPISLVITLAYIMVVSLLGPSEDGFADGLSIPDDIEISEPADWGEASRGGLEDAFQTRLLAALAVPGGEDPSVTAELPSLVRLRGNAPDILNRYLATSPSWRVFRADGARFATRRWMIGPRWRYNPYGYYTRHDIDLWPSGELPRFQSRLTLGLSGKPRRRPGHSTPMRPGETSLLELSMGNQMHESHCVISLDGWVVEVFEQSEAKERRLTKAALAHLEEELRPLAEAPELATIQKMLPSGMMKRGEPAIELGRSFQPGIYDSEIWVNPGEPGMIYLKAYEVTGEYRLSADRLKERSNEWVGWSEDPSQLFFSNTHFTISEGDWGKPYAARFEVWFIPDSGENERKLMERIFKIEGWQR